MRAVLAVPMISLLGCSSLLGIENPSTGDDAPSDADKMDAPPSGDHLEFTIGDFGLPQRGRRRVGVKLVRQAGGSDDVTTTATYTSDNDALVGVSSPGVVDSLAAQAGEAFITASYPDVIPAKIKVTVKATLCHPVINEFMTGNGSGATAASNEFVEIYNPCAVSIDTSTWTLVYRGRNTATGPDDRAMSPVVGPMASGAFQVYAGLNYSGAVAASGQWTDPSGVLGQNDGAIGLRSGPKDTGALVDAVAYGAVTTDPVKHPFIETQPVPAIAHGSDAARKPYDGKDDDNGPADFVVSTTSTPGKTNAP